MDVCVCVSVYMCVHLIYTNLQLQLVEGYRRQLEELLSWETDIALTGLHGTESEGEQVATRSWFLSAASSSAYSRELPERPPGQSRRTSHALLCLV